MASRGRDYGTSAETDALLPGSNPVASQAGLFVPLAQRTRKDAGWTIFWVTTYLLTVAAGVATFLNR